jgi:hypothetical protein
VIEDPTKKRPAGSEEGRARSNSCGARGNKSPTIVNAVAIIILIGAGAGTSACGVNTGNLNPLANNSIDCATFDGPNPTADEFVDSDQQKTAKSDAIMDGISMSHLDAQQEQARFDDERRTLGVAMPRIPEGSVAKYTHMFCDYASDPAVATSLGNGLSDSQNALSQSQKDAGAKLTALEAQYPALRARSALMGCGVSMALGNKIDLSDLTDSKVKEFTLDSYRLFCPGQMQ